MVYVTSDLHGFPLSHFLTLLKQADFGPEDDLYILGDVIDRGDGGIELLCWIMEQENVELLLGNHEVMLLACDFLFQEITDDMLANLTAEELEVCTNWLSNGAHPTILALHKLYKNTPERVIDLLDFLRSAPLYEIISVKKQDFILTHSGLGNFRKEKRLSEYTAQELLLNRPNISDRYFDRAITVFGHTPVEYLNPSQPDRMLRTDTWINVDTGSACGRSPMLLRLDDMQEFYYNQSPQKSSPQSV